MGFISFLRRKFRKIRSRSSKGKVEVSYTVKKGDYNKDYKKVVHYNTNSTDDKSPIHDGLELNVQTSKNKGATPTSSTSKVSRAVSVVHRK